MKDENRKKKVVYYCNLLVLILLVCIFEAFTWRWSNTLEPEGFFRGIFMISAFPFPLLAWMVGGRGVKSGVVKAEMRWVNYFVDNVIFVLLSPVILNLMAKYDIIVIKSGGDLSGIEFLFYLCGLVIVEAVNLVVCILIKIVRS